MILGNTSTLFSPNCELNLRCDTALLSHYLPPPPWDGPRWRTVTLNCQASFHRLLPNKNKCKNMQLDWLEHLGQLIDMGTVFGTGLLVSCSFNSDDSSLSLSLSFSLVLWGLNNISSPNKNHCKGMLWAYSFPVVQQVEHGACDTRGWVNRKLSTICLSFD